MNKKEDLLCKNILGLDKTIRFVGIASIEGKLIAREYREGLEPMLTKGESELSVMQSIRLNTISNDTLMRDYQKSMKNVLLG